MRVWQTLVQRETDRDGIRAGNYRVLDCFYVDADAIEHDKGRKVYRVKHSPGKVRAVAILIMECRPGSYISVRRLLGKKYQRAGRA